MSKSQWKNRICGHADVDPAALVANPDNYKAHPDHQRDALAQAIEHIGFVRSVTVSKRTGLLLDGHLRVALAIRDGQKKIAVEYVDLTPAEEKAVLATLDPLAELRELNQGALDILIAEVGKKNPALNDLLAQISVPIPAENLPIDEADMADTKNECPKCGFKW